MLHNSQYPHRDSNTDNWFRRPMHYPVVLQEYMETFLFVSMYSYLTVPSPQQDLNLRIIQKSQSVEGFEPPNNKVATYHLEPLGYTLIMNDLISLCLLGKPLLISHFLQALSLIPYLLAIFTRGCLVFRSSISFSLGGILSAFLSL